MGFGNSRIEGEIILSGKPECFQALTVNLIPESEVQVAADVLGELSNVVGGLVLNDPLIRDPYDQFALAPPIKFLNNGDVHYLENSGGINLGIKLSAMNCHLHVGFLLQERTPFYTSPPDDGCEPI